MPPSPSPPSKASPDDNASRVSEAALRKKKNADAQAAFRARRANYIATLEQTVTNLETVVLQLQDSCKEAKSQNDSLQREVERWKQAARQNERAAKRFQLLQAQQRSSGMIANGQSHEYSSLHQPSAVGAPPMSPSLIAHYGDNGMRYASNGDQSVSLGGAFQHAGMTQDVQQRSPTAYSNAVAANGSGDGRSQHMDSQRMHRYDQYYAMSNGAGHDGQWAHSGGQAGMSPSDVLDSGSSSHSPSYVESPTLTSPELGYPQYSMDEKSDILDSPSYVFNTDSRSISPAVSTPTSSSSASSVATFPFTFQSEPMMQDRTEFGYRRTGPAPQLTLHGGMADITVAPPRRDGSRYGVPRLSNPLTDRPITQALAAYSRSENESGGRDHDSDSESSYGYSRSRQRSEAPSGHGSRSPSPVPPICGTLAVIKAQAFGALRRTRTKGKRTTESAARAAVEALEARGIEMGITVGSKRPRLHDDVDARP
ncbi:hypothetical protein EVJ58_g216 [Rhodofomes roseus]|uniref:BZIP domain-containing protein n=1 Tax=Rhodofomes roseus TaxID=34475 RepID=A0A4Y9Z7C8_9APHY|nr:hypothetical protein EVJ58_g216 [Rhodofomes roseus]